MHTQRVEMPCEREGSAGVKHLQAKERQRRPANQQELERGLEQSPPRPQKEPTLLPADPGTSSLQTVRQEISVFTAPGLGKHGGGPGGPTHLTTDSWPATTSTKGTAPAALGVSASRWGAH